MSTSGALIIYTIIIHLITYYTIYNPIYLDLFLFLIELESYTRD